MALVEQVEFFTSKNKPLLFFNNRLYRENGRGDGEHNFNVYYLCSTHKRIQCNGRLKKSIVTGEIIRTRTCIGTCRELSEEEILASRAKTRLFKLVRSQPHNAAILPSLRLCAMHEFLHCYPDVDLASPIMHHREGVLLSLGRLARSFVQGLV